MPSTAAQKAAITTFVSRTHTTDAVAKRFLKNTNYNVNLALDQFYGAFGNHGHRSGSDATKLATLDRMFDELRDATRDGKDELTFESIEEYLRTLGVPPLQTESDLLNVLVVMEIVRSTELGKISRKGYVEGWMDTGVDASTAAHNEYVRRGIEKLSTDMSYLQKVYRLAFLAGKEPAQKEMLLEHAIVNWEMFLGPSGPLPWRSPQIDWFECWRTYLGEKVKRSVSKDTWNQTLEFAKKTLEEPSLDWWDLNGSWLILTDDFVTWLHENGIVAVSALEEGE